MFISFLGLPKPRPLSQPPGQLYKPRGCFKDSSRTAMGRMLAGSRLRKRRDAGMACLHLAGRGGYRAFGVQNGGDCFSGPLAHRTYNRYMVLQLEARMEREEVGLTTCILSIKKKVSWDRSLSFNEKLVLVVNSFKLNNHLINSLIFNRHGLIVVKYGATLREMSIATQAWIVPSYPHITYLLLRLVFQLYLGTCAHAILFWARAFLLI